MSFKLVKDEVVTYKRKDGAEFRVKFYSLCRKRGYAFVTNMRGENLRQVKLSRLSEEQ